MARCRCCRLINSLYLLSLNIGHRIEEFTNLMLSPLLGILILQAPTVFMIIMDSIFIRHGSNYNHSATLACYLLSIGFLTAALLGSTAYDMLRQSVIILTGEHVTNLYCVQAEINLKLNLFRLYALCFSPHSLIYNNCDSTKRWGEVCTSSTSITVGSRKSTISCSGPRWTLSKRNPN